MERSVPNELKPDDAAPWAEITASGTDGSTRSRIRGNQPGSAGAAVRIGFGPRGSSEGPDV